MYICSGTDSVNCQEVAISAYAHNINLFYFHRNNNVQYHLEEHVNFDLLI
jgi:hypothetical protein